MIEQHKKKFKERQRSITGTFSLSVWQQNCRSASSWSLGISSPRTSSFVITTSIS